MHENRFLSQRDCNLNEEILTQYGDSRELCENMEWSVFSVLNWHYLFPMGLSLHSEVRYAFFTEHGTEVPVILHFIWQIMVENQGDV
ncbi:unnamed protein product [Caretta caretta]